MTAAPLERTALPPDPTTPAGPAPIAFYLESGGRPLFAWLHPGRLRHGVVLCPPVGHEQVHAYRAWRHLAEAISGRGLPVLRIDYHGTGDSVGTDEDPDRVATWRQNVRDAVRWVRQELGCGRVSLVGLRLGASLAALAAAEEPVEQLVLWAPVVSGRKYVRELRAGAGAAACPPGRGAADDVEAMGFVFTAQTLSDLAALDLLAASPSCRRALVVDRDDLPADGRLRPHLAGLGIDTDQVVGPGYADMMAEPHFTRVPHAAAEAIADWLETGDPRAEPGSSNPGCRRPPR